MRTPKRKAPGELGSGAGHELLTWAAYQLLAIVQRPFGFVFWFIEQRKGRLQDRLANIESEASDE